MAGKGTWVRISVEPQALSNKQIVTYRVTYTNGSVWLNRYLFPKGITYHPDYLDYEIDSVQVKPPTTRKPKKKSKTSGPQPRRYW